MQSHHFSRQFCNERRITISPAQIILIVTETYLYETFFSGKFTDFVVHTLTSQAIDAHALCNGLALQFRKTIGSQSEARNQIGDVLHAEEFKKKKKNMHPIKKSMLLVKNVSCSSTDPKSTDVPPSL